MLEDGTPVIFDPAVSCSDPQAEIAMMELFGSPPRGFRQAYEEAGGSWPSPQRLRLYQLYHLLNHVVLFGGGYAQQALRVARRFPDPSRAGAPGLRHDRHARSQHGASRSRNPGATAEPATPSSKRRPSSRTVLLFGAITDQSASDIARRLVALDADSAAPIDMLVSSPGGHLESATRSTTSSASSPRR